MLQMYLLEHAIIGWQLKYIDIEREVNVMDRDIGLSDTDLEFDLDDSMAFEEENTNLDDSMAFEEENTNIDDTEDYQNYTDSVNEKSIEIENEDNDTEEYGEDTDTEEYGEDNDTEEYGEDNDTEDTILITLIDKKLPGLLEYMRDHKLNTQVVSSDPGYIADIMMAQYGKCDILIIDTGSGLFATSEQRKQILDIVSQCEGNLSAFFYYTDDAIKTDILDSLGRKNKKQVKWEKFQTTPITIASMSLRSTNYVNDSYEYQAYDDSSVDEILDKHITFQTNLSLSEQQPLQQLNPKNILNNVVETEDDLLVGYTPNFKVKMKL